MRKTITGHQPPTGTAPDPTWLDLDRLARVEVTSEEAGFPIEAALTSTGEPHGWRAGASGEQVIRILFDEPLTLRRVRLVFRETESARTQEFVVRWSNDGGRSYRDVVRQQYNFSPPDTVVEEQLYAVDLASATELELRIVPDVSGGEASASLIALRLA